MSYPEQKALDAIDACGHGGRGACSGCVTAALREAFRAGVERGGEEAKRMYGGWEQRALDSERNVERYMVEQCVLRNELGWLRQQVSGLLPSKKVEP